MKYTAKIDTEYDIEISDKAKFLEYFTTEEYRGVYFHFDEMEEILEHLIMVFDGQEASVNREAENQHYFKHVEGIGYFVFDNRIGWSTGENHLKECGFSICISEKETNFDEVELLT